MKNIFTTLVWLVVCFAIILSGQNPWFLRVIAQTWAKMKGAVANQALQPIRILLPHFCKQLGVIMVGLVLFPSNNNGFWHKEGGSIQYDEAYLDCTYKNTIFNIVSTNSKSMSNPFSFFHFYGIEKNNELKFK